MSADDIIGLYERKASAWVADRNRQTIFMEKDWLDCFAALIPPGGTILDVGCGPGKPMAAYLLSQGFRICGVDSSASMVGMAKADFPQSEWIIVDMRKLALNRGFDGVIAWDSFFHLDYAAQRQMFPIFHEHAKPGAPLLFTSGPRHGEAIGNLHGEPLYHASLAPDEYRTLLTKAGFSVVDSRLEDPDCGGHSIWLARREQAE